MIVNWVCFVKLLRIDRTVPVYTDVDVHRGRYRDPLTSPHRLNKGSTIDLSTTDPAGRGSRLYYGQEAYRLRETISRRRPEIPLAVCLTHLSDGRPGVRECRISPSLRPRGKTGQEN